ncbi:neurotrimin isoform X4 [Gadus chalcogrammus]|uniref:neurotrimin isoform X4 n=1 Tax=Gadus chalcogrammus TaxID=1042646 RepID=UPI0024C44ADD|nr:neurotrimin isoform X4 [Gadus chalcogrammus]
MVVNKAESSNNCQAAKKFGVTECNVRRWRAPKQRLKDANSQRKSYRGPQSGRLITSEKTRFGRSRWKRSSWGAMTARANTAGQRTCVRDRETSHRRRNLVNFIPPKIINLSRDLVVNEGSNVTLMCQASGKPEPSISWKLISPSGDLVSDDEYLEIQAIPRHRAGTYECTAINEIDADVQSVDITVNYAPSVSEGRDIGVTLGQIGVMECEADAVPEADFEWYKDDRRIYNGFEGMEIETSDSLSKLTFFNVSEGDYGNYTCIALNKLGSANTSFLLYEVIEPTSSTLLQGPRAVQDGSGGVQGMHSPSCLLLLLIAMLPLLLRI